MRYVCASLWNVYESFVGRGRCGSAEEQHPEMTQYHIIQNWLWLGAVNSLKEATTLIRAPAGFDHDGYKILCKPLLSGNYEITELDR